MKSFADRLSDSIKKSGSVVVAGIDPVVESLPKIFLDEGIKGTSTEDALFKVLSSYGLFALETLRGAIAAVKPNSAFFEQYGIGGMRALLSICKTARGFEIPVILDAKRGDIGSTAQAYSRASIGTNSWKGSPIELCTADAVTVNPYLGFDTLKPFLDDCVQNGKGIFILVKTSNPGSGDLQGIRDAKSSQTAIERIAEWIAKNSLELVGDCGFSGLGAVVGATYPDEARALRTLMPNNFFLIPGYGAQGADASSATAGFSPIGCGGGLVNISRGLFTFSAQECTREELKAGLTGRITKANGELNAARPR